ncbi:MAG: hypothetical protein ACXWCH_31105 [Burkholderiales bacterium]
MAKTQVPDFILTRREAARIARLSLSAFDEALRQGVFPSVRVGRRILIPRGGLLKALSVIEADTK